jgi:hypothetical protein
MSQITKARPRAILQGIRDLSRRTPPVEPEQIPQHLPHVYLFTERGPTLPHLVVGASRTKTYGARSFDYLGPYANHATVLSNVVNARGNAAMIQRLKPADATTSKISLSFEVIKDVFVEYDRKPDGTVRIDSQGYPVELDENGTPLDRTDAAYLDNGVFSEILWQAVPRLTFVGYRGRWIMDTARVFGEGVVAQGDMTSAIAGADSTVYPILDLEVDSFGEYGNRIGLSLSAPTVNTLPPVDASLANSVKAATYRFQVVERPVDASTPNVVSTMFGETAIDLTLKSGLVNPRIGNQISATEVFIDRYRNIDTPGFPPEYGPFGNLHIYEDAIEDLTAILAIGNPDAPANVPAANALSAAGDAAWTAALAADDTLTVWEWWKSLTRADRATYIGTETAIGAEAGWFAGVPLATGGAYAAEEADITGHYTFSNLDNIHLLNIVSAVDMDGRAYRNLRLNGPDSEDNTGLLMSSRTRHYAVGGSDGDISLGNFDVLVKNEAENWGDLEATLLDRAKYPQSIIYDSGFSIETKRALLTPIGLRKDMAVILSTQELGYWDRTVPEAPVWITRGPNSASDESNNAILLKGAAELYPESEVYGTSVCRAAIIGHTGHLINSQYKGWLPLTIDVADKIAGYMGAGIGSWTAGQAPDIAPNNQVSRFKDVNVPYKKDVVYDNDWDSGLVWVQHFDRQNLFYPAWQTVYSDDTSVLNSLITMLACVELEKVADRSWRELTGRSDLTNEQFIERSDALIEERTRDRFDGRFIIVPETYFTEADEIRGYSWSTNIKIYANNMKTVGSMTIEAWRQSDFGQ